MAKITEEQLEKIVKSKTEIQDILTNIGSLETQKHSLLHKIAEVNEFLENCKKELEKEYGKVSVDLQTGEYTEITEKA
tara:strand:- start:54 stop:287 length:234 start_codon:yes stop_codon:yes gene_type:complete